VSQIKPKNGIVEIILAGGLGNQLFQMARALQLASPEKIYLNLSHLKTNPTAKRNPDILDFNLSLNFEVSNDSYLNRVRERLINLGFRLSSLQIPEHISLRVVKTINYILNILYKLKWVNKTYFVNAGVGFNEMTPEIEGHICLIGYFQSYRWSATPQIEKYLKKLELSQKFELYQKFQLRAEEYTPLVVHVRMGDYLDENKFGIPASAYYKNSISELWSTNEFKEIWLFSDSPELALSKIPKQLVGKCQVIENLDLSASQTLELMRLGSGYVISNSTFGWWGAYLSKRPDAKVIFPDPWFANLKDPRDLCPKDWLPRSRIG
jgi:hypothetical protein